MIPAQYHCLTGVTIQYQSGSFFDTILGIVHWYHAFMYIPLQHRQIHPFLSLCRVAYLCLYVSGVMEKYGVKFLCTKIQESTLVMCIFLMLFGMSAWILMWVLANTPFSSLYKVTALLSMKLQIVTLMVTCIGFVKILRQDTSHLMLLVTLKYRCCYLQIKIIIYSIELWWEVLNMQGVYLSKLSLLFSFFFLFQALSKYGTLSSLFLPSLAGIFHDIVIISL